MRSDCVFFCPVTVRFNEVDRQGIVYNANYLVYTDFAFEEFLRSGGHSYRELSEDMDSEVCHRKSTMEFFSSAFEGEQLEVGVRILHIGNRSFTVGFEIYRKEEDEIIVSAETVFCGYDVKNRKSRPISGAMRALLS
ncbi:MAG: acyl-CoA thioesterase [Lachnospiraceae bacterium]|nr:acyl-CoA thioesterase [Lachnospiraceae bacterium]